jgi:hypothetical protein
MDEVARRSHALPGTSQEHVRFSTDNGDDCDKCMLLEFRQVMPRASAKISEGTSQE